MEKEETKLRSILVEGLNSDPEKQATIQDKTIFYSMNDHHNVIKNRSIKFENCSFLPDKDLTMNFLTFELVKETRNTSISFDNCTIAGFIVLHGNRKSRQFIEKDFEALPTVTFNNCRTKQWEEHFDLEKTKPFKRTSVIQFNGNWGSVKIDFPESEYMISDVLINAMSFDGLEISGKYRQLQMTNRCEINYFKLINTQIDGLFLPSEIAKNVNFFFINEKTIGYFNKTIRKGAIYKGFRNTVKKQKEESDAPLANNLVISFQRIYELLLGEKQIQKARQILKLIGNLKTISHKSLTSKIKYWFIYIFMENLTSIRAMIIISAIIVFVNSVIYCIFSINSSYKLTNGDIDFKTLYDALYFSMITFTTVGFGDIHPTGGLRFVAAIEAWE